MLGAERSGEAGQPGARAWFTDLGTQSLIDEMLRLGASKSRMVVKVAGGADMLELGELNVGAPTSRFSSPSFIATTCRYTTSTSAVIVPVRCSSKLHDLSTNPRSPGRIDFAATDGSVFVAVDGPWTEMVMTRASWKTPEDAPPTDRSETTTSPATFDSIMMSAWHGVPGTAARIVGSRDRFTDLQR